MNWPCVQAFSEIAVLHREMKSTLLARFARRGHLLACTPREQRAALNVLKYLSNKLRVSIIALGTNEALHVMRTDPQIASRFESCALPAWAATEDLRRFIAGFLMQLGVEAADIVNNAVAIDYILDLTSGVTGRIVELLRQSARLALGREAATVSRGAKEICHSPEVNLSIRP